MDSKYRGPPVDITGVWDTSSSLENTTQQGGSVSGLSSYVPSFRRRSSSSSVSSVSSVGSAKSAGSSITVGVTTPSYTTTNSSEIAALRKELEDLKPRIFHEDLWYCKECPPMDPYFLRKRPCARPLMGWELLGIGNRGGGNPFLDATRGRSVMSETGYHTANPLTQFDATNNHTRLSDSLEGYSSHSQSYFSNAGGLSPLPR